MEFGQRKREIGERMFEKGCIDTRKREREKEREIAFEKIMNGIRRLDSFSLLL